jgi:hypothetical protein
MGAGSVEAVTISSDLVTGNIVRQFTPPLKVACESQDCNVPPFKDSSKLSSLADTVSVLPQLSPVKFKKGGPYL